MRFPFFGGISRARNGPFSSKTFSGAQQCQQRLFVLNVAVAEIVDRKYFPRRSTLRWNCPCRQGLDQSVSVQRIARTIQVDTGNAARRLTREKTRLVKESLAGSVLTTPTQRKIRAGGCLRNSSLPFRNSPASNHSDCIRSQSPRPKFIGRFLLNQNVQLLFEPLLWEKCRYCQF